MDTARTEPSYLLCGLAALTASLVAGFGAAAIATGVILDGRFTRTVDAVVADADHLMVLATAVAAAWIVAPVAVFAALRNRGRPLAGRTAAYTALFYPLVAGLMGGGLVVGADVAAEQLIPTAIRWVTVSLVVAAVVGIGVLPATLARMTAVRRAEYRIRREVAVRRPTLASLPTASSIPMSRRQPSKGQPGRSRTPAPGGRPPAATGWAVSASTPPEEPKRP